MPIPPASVLGAVEVAVEEVVLGAGSPSCMWYQYENARSDSWHAWCRTYDTLELADLEAVQNLSCLIAVSDILEGFRCVLPANVEEDFFTAAANTIISAKATS